MAYTEARPILKDKTKCAAIRADLKMCLLESDCCKIVSDNYLKKNMTKSNENINHILLAKTYSKTMSRRSRS